jgi:hypothetical protein
MPEKTTSSLGGLPLSAVLEFLRTPPLVPGVHPMFGFARARLPLGRFLVSAGSAWAWPLVLLRSSGRATGLRWFSSGRLVFAVCACRAPQSPGRSPSGLARSSPPPTSSVTLGPPSARIPLEFGCSRQFHTCGHLVLTVPRVR